MVAVPVMDYISGVAQWLNPLQVVVAKCHLSFFVVTVSCDLFIPHSHEECADNKLALRMHNMHVLFLFSQNAHRAQL